MVGRNASNRLRSSCSRTTCSWRERVQIANQWVAVAVASGGWGLGVGDWWGSGGGGWDGSVTAEWAERSARSFIARLLVNQRRTPDHHAPITPIPNPQSPQS